jgi:hypothetical protein
MFEVSPNFRFFSFIENFSPFNRQVHFLHLNMLSFRKFLQGEENRLNYMRIQFTAGLEPDQSSLEQMRYNVVYRQSW